MNFNHLYSKNPYNNLWIYVISWYSITQLMIMSSGCHTKKTQTIKISSKQVENGFLLTFLHIPVSYSMVNHVNVPYVVYHLDSEHPDYNNYVYVLYYVENILLLNVIFVILDNHRILLIVDLAVILNVFPIIMALIFFAAVVVWHSIMDYVIIMPMMMIDVFVVDDV